MATPRQQSVIADVLAPSGVLNFLGQLHGEPALLKKEVLMPRIGTPRFLRGRSIGRGFGGSARRTVMFNSNAQRRQDTFEKQVTYQDESHFLGHLAQGENAEPLRIYFRSVRDGYRLYLRFGPRSGDALYLHNSGCVGAFKVVPGGAEPTVFQLLNANNQYVSPLHLLHDHVRVRLAVEGTKAPLRLRRYAHSPFTYLGCAGDGEPFDFSLHTVERNAPWLSQPDEV